MVRKVMKPKGWDPKKLKHFPVWVQPKIDGVRGYCPEGTLLARTQKKHKNRFVTAQFSNPMYIGFDGEIAAERETHPALCRLTQSAVGTFEGEPFVLWWVFDYVTEDTAELSYRDRYNIMSQRVKFAQSKGLCGHLRVMPYVECNSLAEVEAVHQHNINQGFEGSCIWDPAIPHKEGDSSPTHRGVLRIKDFTDIEGVILGVTEGEHNANEAQINELGRQYRTSHQEGKVPNGLIGSIQMRALADLVCPQTKRVLFKAGEEFTAAPGELDHKERKLYFDNQHEFVGKIGKVKIFAKGMKDKPRFPQFVSLRSVEDL